MLFVLDKYCRTLPIKSAQNPDPDQKCVIPYNDVGFSFHKCVKSEKEDNFWCVTGDMWQEYNEVDSNESYDYEEHEINIKNVFNKYGLCAETCPKENKSKIMRGYFPQINQNSLNNY